jgi:Mrp family chromosome partitioning ATPase
MPEHEEAEESITQKVGAMKGSSLYTLDGSTVKAQMNLLSTKENRVQTTQQQMGIPIVETPHEKLPPINKRDVANAQMLRVRCRQICLSVFFREHAPVSSLGFTSAISGEGKSFLALVAAGVLGNDSSGPVTLLEFNWDHPCLHEFFGIPSTPGLAEWLRGECSEGAIRHQVDHNLTIIPAGYGRQDEVKLLQKIRQKGLPEMFARSNELLIADLPAVLTTAYGSLAASLVESLVIVVRARATTDRMVAETCEELKALPVQGLILNQVESRIPRWIRQLL